MDDARLVRFLSDAARELAELPEDGDLYGYAADRLSELLPGTIVATTEVVSDDRVLVRAVRGLGPLASLIEKSLGVGPAGMVIRGRSARSPERDDGQLVRLASDPYEASQGGIPRKVAAVLTRVTGIEAIHIIDLSWDGNRFGAISFVSRRGGSLEHTGVVEAFARQLSMAIQARSARATLRREVADHQAMFRAMPGAAAIFAVEGPTEEAESFRLLEVNHSFEQLLGKESAALTGRTLHEVMPDPGPGWLEAFAEVVESGESTRFERPNRGLRRHLSCNAYAPGPGQLAIILQDVTARVEARRAVSRLEERHRWFLEGMTDVVVTASPDGVLTYVSPSVTRFAGYDPAAEVGEHISKYFQQEQDRELIAKKLRAMAESGERAIVEIQYTPLTGEPFPVEVEARPVMEGGSIVAIHGVMRDIRQRRQADAERRELEQNVQQVQKLESLGVLAGGIAHDFNNLLMGILGNAELAHFDVPEGTAVARNLEDISAAANRAADLTRQMLAYSGKGKFVIERVSLRKLLEEMAHLLGVSISKKASIEYDLAEDVPEVEADPEQLRQLVLSLVTNGSDAMGGGEGLIRVAVGSRLCDREQLRETYLDEDQPEGRYAFIEVSDDGEGMDDATRKRIFDPFFTTRFPGRGLGLAAALGIVRGHSGAIRVDSRKGEGTTVRVLLPALEDRVRCSSDPPAVEGGRPSYGTALVVDDDETVYRVAERMLERIGFEEVLVAEDGVAALDRYRHHEGKISCVLLDLSMPRMDGEETLRELQRIDPQVRVILSSGYDVQDVAQRFTGTELAGFVQKPYRYATLAETIRKALES